MRILNKYKEDTRHRDCIYIGRGSPLGNPFPISQFSNRVDVIELHKQWIVYQLRNDNMLVIDTLRTLKEYNDLACYCSPCACHGDTIKEIMLFIWKYVDFDTGLKEYLEKTPSIFRYKALDDGITHTNISGKAKTDLGKLLDPLAEISVTFEDYGYFSSIDGFVRWYKTGMKHEVLRNHHGRDINDKITKYKIMVDEVPLDILQKVLYEYIKSSEHLEGLFTTSKLPFTSYIYLNAKVLEVLVKSSDMVIPKLYSSIRELTKPEEIY